MKFLSALTLIFITLKLTSVITWGWFWILSPIIIPIAAYLCTAAIIVLITGIISFLEKP